MTNKQLGYFVLLGTIIMAGLLSVQVYWTRQAMHAHQAEWKQEVRNQLYEAGLEIEALQPKNKSIVKVVPINERRYRILVQSEASEADIAKALKSSLAAIDQNMRYEWSLIDTKDDSTVFVQRSRLPVTSSNLSDMKKDIAVYFPDQLLVSQGMDVWWVSTILLLLLLLFFAMALYRIMKEKRLKEIKDDFISNMTHELKTPVAGIQLAAEVLNNPDNTLDNQQRQRYYHILLKESSKLKHHIDQVLEWTIKPGKQFPLHKETLDLHGLIEEAGERYVLRTAHQGKIKMALKGMQHCIQGDLIHLSNAIDNILVNAEKYAKDIPEVSISTKDVRSGIELIISDRGTGIPTKYLNKVFERFFRVPKKSFQQRGQGLGLYYTARVIQAHQGQIEVNSAHGKGTDMKIFLPYA